MEEISSLSGNELIGLVKWNDAGLVPVIVQEDGTGQVLMMAWMNEESLKKTLEEGRMTYFSRSRKSLWLKGETSGHFQKLLRLEIDCDGDTLLAHVIQTGAACHTGKKSCFYRGIQPDELPNT